MEYHLISKTLKDNPPPYKGLVIEVVEYTTHYALRFKRDNIESFSEDKKVSIIIWINSILEKFVDVYPVTLEIV